MRKTNISFLSLGLAVLLAILVGLSLQEERVKAGNEHNASGFAWSENIGWVSFNSTDCDADGNGFVDEGNCGGDNASQPISNYGVHIDETGDFSGYAWSENVGWIKFDPVGPYPSQPNSSASLSTGNNQVSGWARACAGAEDEANCSGGTNPNSGGWDGWIKLRKHSSDGGSVPDYGVTYNPATSEFEGWAWGSDVVGWLSFNCSNEGQNCEESDYSVSYFSSELVAAFHCDASCAGFPGEITLVNDSTPETGPNKVKTSHWIINDNEQSPCNGTCDWTVSSPSSPGNYPVKLRVENDNGQTDTSPEQTITIKQDLEADFDCSLDEATWVACTSLSDKVSEGERVYVRDQSIPSDGASLSSWEWRLNGNVFSNDPNADVQLESGNNTIRLEVDDTAGRGPKSRSYAITSQFPFPFWKEISPF